MAKDQVERRRLSVLLGETPQGRKGNLQKNGKVLYQARKGGEGKDSAKNSGT